MAFTLAATTVDVGLNSEGFVSGLQKVKLASQALGATFKSALAPLLAFTAGAFAIKEIVGAAAEAEAADTRLAQALANSGNEVDSNSAKFSEFATNLQRSTTLGDEAIKNLISTGLNLGIPADQADKFATSAIGLGRALGIDASTAMELLAKESAGVASSLSRQIPALNGVEDASQRMAIISQFAANGMKEEQAQALTLSGGFSQFKEVIGDAAEIVGGAVAGPLTAMLGWFKDQLIWVQNLWGAIKEFGVQSSSSFSGIAATVEFLGNVFGGVVQFMKDLITQIVFYFLNWDLTIQQLSLMAQKAFWTMVGAVEFFAVQSWENIKWFWNNLGDIAMTACNFVVSVLKNLGDNIVEVFKAAFDAVRTGSFEPFANLVFKDLTEGFVSAVKELPKQLNMADFVDTKAIDDKLNQVDAEFSDRSKKWQEIVADATKPPEKIEAPKALALNQAGLDREQEKLDKTAGQESKSSNVGATGGIMEAWRKINEGLMKGQDKAAQEALATQKKQLEEQRKTNDLLRNNHPQVAIAG